MIAVGDKFVHICTLEIWDYIGFKVKPCYSILLKNGDLIIRVPCSEFEKYFFPVEQMGLAEYD